MRSRLLPPQSPDRDLPPYADRERRRAFDRANYQRRKAGAYWSSPQQHRLESHRDLAAYLRKRGSIHMHWVRRGGNHGWVLIYESRTPVCDDPARCVMIPLRVE